MGREPAERPRRALMRDLLAQEAEVPPVGEEVAVQDRLERFRPVRAAGDDLRPERGHLIRR